MADPSGSSSNLRNALLVPLKPFHTVPPTHEPESPHPGPVAVTQDADPARLLPRTPAERPGPGAVTPPPPWATRPNA